VFLTVVAAKSNGDADPKWRCADSTSVQWQGGGATNSLWKQSTLSVTYIDKLRDLQNFDLVSWTDQPVGQHSSGGDEGVHDKGVMGLLKNPTDAGIVGNIVQERVWRDAKFIMCRILDQTLSTEIP
jgi:hypothetical protein